MPSACGGSDNSIPKKQLSGAMVDACVTRVEASPEHWHPSVFSFESLLNDYADSLSLKLVSICCPRQIE